MSKQQGTYQLKHLTTGTVYRDVLSGYLVLLTELHLEATPPQGRGLYWNPVYGAHQPVTVYNDQLASADSCTLIADKRHGA
jgi:hypothetical protein